MNDMPFDELEKRVLAAMSARDIAEARKRSAEKSPLKRRIQRNDELINFLHGGKMFEQPKSTLPKRPISDYHLFRTWNLFNMVGGVIGQIYAPTKEEAFEWARERWGKLLYSVDLERRPEETWAPIYWS